MPFLHECKVFHCEVVNYNLYFDLTEKTREVDQTITNILEGKVLSETTEQSKSNLMDIRKKINLDIAVSTSCINITSCDIYTVWLFYDMKWKPSLASLVWFYVCQFIQLKVSFYHWIYTVTPFRHSVIINFLFIILATVPHIQANFWCMDLS